MGEHTHTYLKSLAFPPKRVVARLMFQWFSMFSHVGKQEPISSLWISVMEKTWKILETWKLGAFKG